jgi:hypothetical protein
MARVSNIDDDLLEEAVHYAGHNGEAYALNMALKEFVENRKKGIDAAFAAFGSVKFDDDWSPVRRVVSRTMEHGMRSRVVETRFVIVDAVIWSKAYRWKYLDTVSQRLVDELNLLKKAPYYARRSQTRSLVWDFR